MTLPLQVLFFMAITLSPPGTRHVTISGGTEVYSWERGETADGATTWTYDWAAVDPMQTLLSNDIVPAHLGRAERALTKSAQRSDGDFVLRFDAAHQLEKNSQGYVYVVRPGSPTQKFYSFIFE